MSFLDTVRNNYNRFIKKHNYVNKSQQRVYTLKQKEITPQIILKTIIYQEVLYVILDNKIIISREEFVLNQDIKFITSIICLLKIDNLSMDLKDCVDFYHLMELDSDFFLIHPTELSNAISKLSVQELQSIIGTFHERYGILLYDVLTGSRTSTNFNLNSPLFKYPSSTIFYLATISNKIIKLLIYINRQKLIS